LTGTCRNGDCTYAHGLTELRPGTKGPDFIACMDAVTPQSGTAGSQQGGFQLSTSDASTGMADTQERFQQQWLPQPQQQQQQWTALAGSSTALPPTVLQAAQQAAQQAAEEAAKRVIQQEANRWLGQQPGVQQQQRQLPVPLQRSWQQVPRQQAQPQMMQQWQQQMQGGQPQENDQALLHQVLAEIMQLLIEEDNLELVESQPDSAAASVATHGWGSVTSRVLAKRRKELLLEGKCLIMNDRRGHLSFSEEQILVYLFLREPAWVELFPRLVMRCSRMMASRLSTQLRPDGDAGLAGPIPSHAPEPQPPPARRAALPPSTTVAASPEGHCRRSWASRPQCPEQAPPQEQRAAAPIPQRPRFGGEMVSGRRPNSRPQRSPRLCAAEVPMHQLYTRSLDVLPDTASWLEAEEDIDLEELPGFGAALSSKDKALFTRSFDSLPLPPGLAEDRTYSRVQEAAYDRQAFGLLSQAVEAAGLAEKEEPHPRFKVGREGGAPQEKSLRMMGTAHVCVTEAFTPA